MKVSICPTTFDLQAPLISDILLSGSDFDKQGRRVTRTATLDGGSVFYDSGYAVSDRDVAIILPVIPGIVELASWFTQYHSDLTISIPNGIYRCVIKDISVDQDQLTINLYLKSNA